jgi:hypothetical protein
LSRKRYKQKKYISPKKQESNVILSSGPIEATPFTELISLNIINVDSEQAREVFIEMKNWTTSPPEELEKHLFLCGEQIDPCEIGYCNENNESFFDPTVLPDERIDDFPPITTPIFFQLPPQMQLTVLALFPQPPELSTNPCYEVRVYTNNPENFLVSSYGLNEDYVPQPGNIVLNQQFYPLHSINLPFPVTLKKALNP